MTVRGVYQYNTACGCDWCVNGGEVPAKHAHRGHGFGFGHPHIPPTPLHRGRALLCIMHARQIPECIDSLERLQCDKAWMTGYTDAELGAVHEQLVADTDYDFYITVSDDCIVTRKALDAVLDLLHAGHPAVTGWCRLHRKSPLVNLSTRPLRGKLPSKAGYSFPRFDEIINDPRPVIPTHFMGFSLTGMTRELWRRFPHRAYTQIRASGYSSDFNLCSRLRDAGVPMVAARDGYVEHMKVAGRKPPSHALLIGQMTQEVRVEAAQPR